ncbi:superoxide dismutase [Niallia circulans]|jgi:superoxide dismutase, Fe-Mn family|uniref:superoxide dismutase n=1 Tax=Niallia circulans TaxID=1397 RepID=UPI000BA5DD6D|nr:superoxide dismutase [Niallia circulans]PAE11841.1 superoxide dismutase [Niallia circulans]
MSSYNEYVRNVLIWNQELKQLLESEEVQKEESIWKRLDKFSQLMEGVQRKPIETEELIRIQHEAEELHEQMESYFAQRQQLGTIFIKEPTIAAGEHQLPQLAYAYDALEPYISKEIMELHHQKHHQSYVTGLNKAEEKLKEARKNNDFALVKHWSRELAFHGSGHYLHTIFWNNMSPNGGGKPKGALMEEIRSYFGSFNAFKNHFSEAAKAVEGVGWALLVWSPRARRLELLQSERHMLLTQWDTIPLLVLDVWEHAYYLQYKNNRGDYVDNWWNIVNWKDVENRFLKASELKWRPY